MLLNEIDASLLRDVPGLLPIIFPDGCLPLPPSDILAALSTGDSPMYDGAKWVDCPDLTVPSVNGDVEALLVAFLDTFGDRVAEVCRAAGKTLPGKRAWSAKFANKGVEDAPNTRKPDFLCTPTGLELRWPNILYHGELKSKENPKYWNETLTQLLNGAYLMFSSQDNRRFIISLSFMGENVRLFIFDRAGLITTFPFNLHTDPESFVRVLGTMMFSDDPAVLGYDTSIVTIPSGRFIEVDGIKYAIVETLFISDVIRGRGTVCWRARHDGQDFVIKDTWADDSRPYTEAEILQKADCVEGVPRVVADVIVKINGVEGSTDTLRSLITPPAGPKGAKLLKTYANIEKRIHRRLVLTPFGHALSKFASRKELISILIDVVAAHQKLYTVANVLHRDISVNNIMLVPTPRTWNSVALSPTSPSLLALASPHPLKVSGDVKPAAPDKPLEPRRGLLIDLDYALVVEPDGERGPTATGHRTGTLPFMAVEVLVDGDNLPAHQPRHDLESLLYVLIWICVHYAGPDNVERQNFDIYESYMKSWVRGDTYSDIGLMKDSGMKTFWQRNILSNFAPYFEPLKPCVSAWRQLYVDSNLTYDAVLGVLRNTLPTLDDAEVWSKKDDPLGYGEEGKKRKRSAFDHLKRINEEDVEDDEDNENDEDNEEEDEEDEHDDKDKDFRPRKVRRSGQTDPRVVKSEPEPAPARKQPRRSLAARQS
ncbi:hypothetical protein C8R44DRAFT_978331 [Mycena epipterygia]|nr:hypothetical protein C8R44DRAFT_978331 [Mycena epipterygia]